MALDHHIIQNSEVYLLNGNSHHQHISPPSPPSPPTPCEARSMTPIPDEIMCITPPILLDDTCPKLNNRLNTAVHVLGTEATALSCLTRLYETDLVARGGFDKAVDAITRCMGHRGKIVICGVGKSGHIAKKLVATMNSLKVSATYLHPTEALHGDLGKVGDFDVILLITFSGRTPELLSLLPHFNPRLPLLVMTSHTHPSTCAIIDQRSDAILLPAPIHEAEKLSFGVSAPTTSTTIALALGDALAVSASSELHPSVSDVFLRNHPGGAIGQAPQKPQKIGDLAVLLSDIPIVGESSKAVHIIMAGYQSSSGWVRQGIECVVPPRRISRLTPEDMTLPACKIRGLLVPSRQWISVPGDMALADTATWIRAARKSAYDDGGEDGDVYDDDAVIATSVNGIITGVLEVGTLLRL